MEQNIAEMAVRFGQGDGEDAGTARIDALAENNFGFVVWRDAHARRTELHLERAVAGRNLDAIRRPRRSCSRPIADGGG
jgi:hypothetical protein